MIKLLLRLEIHQEEGGGRRRRSWPLGAGLTRKLRITCESFIATESLARPPLSPPPTNTISPRSTVVTGAKETRQVSRSLHQSEHRANHQTSPPLSLSHCPASHAVPCRRPLDLQCSGDKGMVWGRHGALSSDGSAVEPRRAQRHTFHQTGRSRWDNCCTV